LARQASVSAKAVFAHWLQVMGKSANTKLTDIREKAIRDRLKSYSQQEIMDAIEGCAASPWHMGNNPEHQLHNDIELICRDDSHVERFMEMAPSVMAAQNRRRKPVAREGGQNKQSGDDGQS